MSSRKPLIAGQVWITRSSETRTNSRRIVAVADGKVCYSTGGDRLRWCQRAQFRLWIRSYLATVQKVSRKPSLALRALRVGAARGGRKARKAFPAGNVHAN